MSAQAEFVADDSVVAEIEIAAPPERVFDAITKSDQLIRWWISPTCETRTWNIDPRPGGRWHFKTGKSTQIINGVDTYEAHGEILEFSPPRMLVYTWVANWNDDPLQTTVVSWELVPSKNGTHLKVTHSGLAKLPVAREDYSGGWVGVLQLLKKFTEKAIGA
jgi:uncharacterized protein YndB with AHSA1/START domain